MLPSLLPDNFFKRSQDSLDSSSKLKWLFFCIAPLFLPLLNPYIWLHLLCIWLPLLERLSDEFVTKLAPCSELHNVRGGRDRSPHPGALRSASACKKGAHFSVLQKSAVEFDFMPLILKKRCTGQLSRLMGLSKLNLSAKSLGFDLCYKSVKFHTKPLAFCTGKMAE